MKKLMMTLGILLGVVILLISLLSLAYRFIGLSKKSNWESELRTELTATDSYDELNTSISRLGVMLGNEHDNWIAIDYRDTHSGITASKAVVRMKDGTLLESGSHFCGLFAGYRHYKQSWEIEQEYASASERLSFKEYCNRFGSEDLLELETIESTQDPQTQEQLLVRLGFKPVTK